MTGNDLILDGSDFARHPDRGREVDKIVSIQERGRTRPRLTRHCSIVWMPVAELAGRIIPIIILADGSISSVAVDYVLHLIKNRSIQTVAFALRAIVLLFDFHTAKYESHIPSQAEQERFFNLFAAAIENGTILRDGSDPMELGWTSRTTPQVRKLTRSCLSFLDYAKKQEEVHGLGGFSSLLNEKRNEDAAFRDKSASYSLLAHLHRPSESRNFQIGKSPGALSKTRRAVGFPTDKLHPLIESILQNTRASKAARVRDALAICLLAYGGIRSSEALHIWMSDIVQDGASARIFVRHPSDFTTKVNGKKQSRRGILENQYNLIPRQLLPPGRLHVGWKGMSFDYDHTAVVYWIDPRAGELFSTLHRQWIMRLRPSAPDHPYYFVNLDQDGDYGGPWTMAGFRQAFRAACQRIGLVVDQANGVNPHGLRHFYGLTAEAMKLSNNVVQQMMHHVSILSQEIYKHPRPEEISSAIAKAASNVENGQLALPAYRSQAWVSDPRQLFPQNWRQG